MLLVVACAPDPTDARATSDIALAAPNITDASVACDADDAEWIFRADADAWTGNGQVVLSADGDYVERHTLYSTAAAADGSSDSLQLTLDVEADWRDVSSGSSTLFNCGAAELGGILRIYTRDGSEQADCRVFGASPGRWTAWDLGVTCQRLLE